MNDETVAVKCFRKDKKREAEQENQILVNLSKVLTECPGAVKYYGMKFLRIKVRDESNEDVDLFSGGLFFQKCDTDLKKLMEAR